MVRLLWMLLALAPLASGLCPSFLSRRQAVVGGLCVPSVLLWQQESEAAGLVPFTVLVDELRNLLKEAHGGKATLKKVTAARTETLEPLRNAMEKNPRNSEEAALQPLLMRGHLLELDQALGSSDAFEPYVSKTTKENYPGGKVERELEEALETADAYCNLADCQQLLIYR